MTQLTHSITAYQTIRQRILALEADIDDTTLADTVEGSDRPQRGGRRRGPLRPRR